MTIHLFLQLSLSNTFTFFKNLFKIFRLELAKMWIFFCPHPPSFPALMEMSPENLRDQLCPRVHSLLFILLPHQWVETNTLLQCLKNVSHYGLGANGRKSKPFPLSSPFTVIPCCLVMPEFPMQLAPASSMYPSWQILKDHKLFATSPIKVASNSSFFKIWLASVTSLTKRILQKWYLGLPSQGH